MGEKLVTKKMNSLRGCVAFFSVRCVSPRIFLRGCMVFLVVIGINSVDQSRNSRDKVR